MELYAIKYGENFKYATKGSVYRGVLDSNDKVDGFVFTYYLALYNGKSILFDTGFRNNDQALNMGITLHDVKGEIDTVINDIYNVDVIFITHSHFDHIDNLDLFINPTIIISDLEYENALQASPIAVKQKLLSSDVLKVKEEFLYDDKFTFKVIGGHTNGSSVIYFNEGDKRYVITGDECYLCDNLIHNIPIGIISDGSKNEKFISDAHRNGLIPLPYHDNSVFLRYERISENIVKVI